MFKFGWKRDLPDARDFKYLLPKIQQIPEKIDLRPSCPDVVHQNNLGTCVGNSIASCYWFVEKRQNSEVFYPSRLFIYYNARKREGTIKQDNGVMIRTGMKTIAKEGVCPEYQWPYIEEKYATKPTLDCYLHAKDHQVLEYRKIKHTMTNLKGCLVSGYPFVFGFSVYDSFESKEVEETGIVPIPDFYKESLIGGHAVMAVGYDDSVNSFIVLNSWGKDWGMEGYFLLPYDYILNKNLAADFWTIRLVEGK
jgi:C1A family cysteine protease